MPVTVPENRSILDLKGIHLWHAGLSSCSQRVRIALAEKGLKFESHIIDLSKGEHATPEYQRIHPKGVVPAIVINGEFIIESIDIIDEIDKRFPIPALHPDHDQAQKDMRILMDIADKSQKHLKLMTFEFLFSAAPPEPAAVKEKLQQNHRNEYLKKFHREATKGFTQERVEDTVNICHKEFIELDRYLSDGRMFLAGDQFSLADIAWMPNIHRFSLFHWPFDRYEHLGKWFKRVTARDSYQTALMDWQPAGLINYASPRIKERVESGNGVASYGLLNQAS